MESVRSLEINKAPQTTIMSTSDQIQALKIPEAVVALAHDTSKVNDLPAWSLLSPCKVQLLKCDKCSQEFCSKINYRRHIRVHRRSLKIDKDFLKNRMLLGAYWDKDVTGSSIMKALTTFIQNLGFPLLPHVYVKAGATLLDIIEGSPSSFPISSQELFGMLDNASEKTFLCPGSALSMQKYIFNGEAGKIALEMKNLVAFASFMIEQKLMKSLYADKNVEALRCQHLLMEEEESAKKRQAELKERVRLKKLRQKEKRVNVLTGISRANNGPCSCDTLAVTCSSTETASLMPASEYCLDTSKSSVSGEIPCREPSRLVESQLDWNMRLHSHVEDADQIVDQEIGTKASGRQLTPTPTNGQILMLTPAKFSVTSTTTNEFMIWSWKTRPDKEDANERNTDPRVQYAYNKCEVLIGSISVALGKSYEHSREATPLVQRHFRRVAKHDLSPNTAYQTEMKFNQFQADSLNHVPVEDMYLASRALDDNDSDRCWNSSTDLGSAELFLPRLFSSDIAKSFLAERWKESMIADHVMLTLPSDSVSLGCPEN